ncbi:hypothetical protein D3C87_1240930 [compost metagenome]
MAGREQREAVGTGGRLRHQRGRDGGQRERIDADHAQRHLASVVAQGQGLELEHRARQRHLGPAREPAEHGLVEAALRGAHLEVGLAVHRAHRAGELVERRGVDELHRKRQRHAQHHGQHGRRVAPGVVAQFLPGESRKQCTHGVIVAAVAGWRLFRR